MKFFEDKKCYAKTKRILLYSYRPVLIQQYLETIDFSDKWVYAVLGGETDLEDYSVENYNVIARDFFHRESREIHFNELLFSDLIGKDKDIDIVISSNVGHNSHIANIFYNKTRHRPSIIGIIPDIQEVTPYLITGILESDVVLCSYKKRKSILQKSKAWFNENRNREISERINVNGNLNLNKIIDLLISRQKRISDRSEAIDRILEKIKEEEIIAKYDLLNWLNWGRQIAWTPYRRKILDNSEYFDTLTSVPHYTYRRESDE